MKLSDILLEYKRDITARSIGDRLIAAIGQGGMYGLPSGLIGVHTLWGLANHPQRYGWGIGQKRFDVLGQQVTVGEQNAAQVLAELKPKIVDALLAEFEQSDPTPNNVFVPWLAREYAKGNIRQFEDIDSMFRHHLVNYVKYKNKRDFPPEAKDIMRLSGPEFLTAMEHYEPPEPEQKNRGQAEEIYSDGNVRVIIPNDEAAACYYGQGTRWCTAATRGHNMFNRYNQDGPMYILLPKDPGHEGERYQLHFPSEQFMDENDDPVELIDILTRRFPGLVDVFLEREPQLQEFVQFAPEEQLRELATLVGQAVEDHAWELTNEWQDGDDGFRQWQAEAAEERGYVDEDGKIDWDRVHEDDELNDYFSYNHEAEYFLRDVGRVVTATVGDLKDAAREAENDSDIDGQSTLRDIPEIFEYMIQEQFGNDDGGLGDFLRERVQVNPNRGAWKYSKDKDGYKLGESGDWYVSIVPKIPRGRR